MMATTNIACFGTTTGAIDVSVIGGVPNYTYLWNTTATTQDLSALNIGQYILQLTDGNGCVVYGSSTISQPAAPLTIQVTGTNITCYNGTDGSINLTINGGSQPYLINWSNGATTEDLYNLLPGIYTVTVTDSNNCVLSGSMNISQPPQPLSINNVNLTQISCYGLSNGQVDISVSGGSFP
jgi:hypothetical protein